MEPSDTNDLTFVRLSSRRHSRGKSRTTTGLKVAGKAFRHPYAGDSEAQHPEN